MTEETVEPPTSCASGEGGLSRASLCGTAVFEIEDTNFRIAGTGDDGSIARVGHEFDRKYVSTMASGNTAIEGKGVWKAGRIVVPDIEMGIIRA